MDVGGNEKTIHNSLIGIDSTFNTNKYGVMLILNDSFETIDRALICYDW